MKTIEERGGDFAANYEVLDDNGRQKKEYEIARESYISGGKDEHELLTRWNDPRNKIPNSDRSVITKWKCDDGGGDTLVSIGRFNGEKWDVQSVLIIPRLFHIIGWREIHE